MLIRDEVKKGNDMTAMAQVSFDAIKKMEQYQAEMPEI
jgi:hypothetical protein